MQRIARFALCFAVLCGAAKAETLPPGFVTTQVLSGLDRPTTLAFASDGRLFIASKDGRVFVLRPGERTPLLFADLRAQVNEYWDRGLLGIAVHPQWPATRHVYLSYVFDPPGVTADGAGGRVQRITRISAKPGDPDAMLPGSEVVLAGLASTRDNIGNETSSDIGAGEGCRDGASHVADCIPADSPAHDGSALAFSPDGLALFVTTGDGAHFGGVDARALRALDPDSLAGKLLRLDPLTGDGLPDNPFWNGAPRSNRSRVYAMGLRNPFRMAIHPLTGEPFVGDVGWNNWEEMNTGRGANFGWPCYEGNASTSARQSGYQNGIGTSATCSALYRMGDGAVKRPSFAYAHSGQGAAIEAGAFLQDASWPEQYRGALFYADYNRDFLRYLTFDAVGQGTSHDFASDLSPSGGPVHVIAGPDGELWYVIFDGASSSIRRLRYVPGNAPPVAVATADPESGAAPLAVSFTGSGSSDPEGDALGFAWDFGDGATSSLADPSHVFAQPGTYVVTLTVTDALGASGEAQLSILAGNDPPQPSIEAPAAGQLFDAGETIELEGSAQDERDGALPGSSLAWDVRIRHEQHVHFDYLHATGSAASLVAPDHGDEEHALQICLRATDSGGAEATVCREILPRRTTLQLATDPPGLSLVYAGSEIVAPFSRETVAGGHRDLVAPAEQGDWIFASWSDGGDRARTLAVGAEPLSLTARYVRACVPGDVAPDGEGDGVVRLGDYILAERKVLGLHPAHDRDTSCGDLHPGHVTCQPAGGTAQWCPEGDGRFAQGDALAVRRIVLGVQAPGCQACATLPHSAMSWKPGDVAPRAAPDGVVAIDDVVFALRAVAGLEHQAAWESLMLDVAPSGAGAGRLDVGDVVLLLRAAVGLVDLDWPQRRLEVSVEAGSAMAGLLLRAPEWPPGVELPALACAAFGGLEAERTASGWAAAGLVERPSERLDLVLTWRGPRVAEVPLSAEAVDEALLPLAARVR